MECQHFTVKSRSLRMRPVGSFVAINSEKPWEFCRWATANKLQGPKRWPVSKWSTTGAQNDQPDGWRTIWNDIMLGAETLEQQHEKTPSFLFTRVFGNRLYWCVVKGWTFGTPNSSTNLRWDGPWRPWQRPWWTCDVRTGRNFRRSSSELWAGFWVKNDQEKKSSSSGCKMQTSQHSLKLRAEQLL